MTGTIHTIFPNTLISRRITCSRQPLVVMIPNNRVRPNNVMKSEEL